MGGHNIVTAMMLSCALMLSSACPDMCSCRPEGRGQRVVCNDGQSIASILSRLPHNTARLYIQGLTSPKTLEQADFVGAPKSMLLLSISNSSLEAVGDSVFSQSLTSLQELDLSMNNIRSIADGAFSGLSRLRLLNLSSNHLSDIGSAFAPLVSLRRLDLDHNKLGDLQAAALQSLSSLSFLSLNYNHFRSLNGNAFHALPFLSELRVHGCGISFISEDFFSSITRVSMLDLGGNNLRTFPSSTEFSELRHLKHLYLNDNELRQLHPSQFADLSLLTLSLARNYIGHIPPDVFNGLSVEDLDLSENKLLELKSESLQPVARHLAVLNVANNPIRQLHPHTFEGLRLLETLNISACSLTRLPSDTFSHLYSLRRLDASWNHLYNISGNLIHVLNRLVMINLHQNSWHCDCHIKHFRNWLRSPRSAHKLHCLPGQQTDDCSDLKCVTPDRLAGKLISNLLDSDLEECSVGGANAGLPVPIQISIVLACLLFSLGMLLLTLYLWRRGRTKKELKKIIFRKKKRRADSHEEEDEDEENNKIPPFVDCDNESLKESHRSFVFRHYFDQMVTDPKLLEPTSPSQMAPSEAGRLLKQRDSVYSSDPALYEASHNSRSIVVGIESTV